MKLHIFFMAIFNMTTCAIVGKPPGWTGGIVNIGCTWEKGYAPPHVHLYLGWAGPDLTLHVVPQH